MFNNFFNFGSPFSTYSDPFYSQRTIRPSYYETPRYYKPTARNYYESDSTDSDEEYQQPIRNIKTEPKSNYTLRPKSNKMDLEEKKYQQPKKNLNKNKFLDFLETSDSESEYEKQSQQKAPERKVEQKVQQKAQSKLKYQEQPKAKQEQQKPKQKQEPKKQQPFEYEQFYKDPKQIVDGICIECDVQEDDFPDFYESAKRTRKINESDNYLIKVSPLGELIEKQLQAQQLQTCQ